MIISCHRPLFYTCQGEEILIWRMGTMRPWSSVNNCTQVIRIAQFLDKYLLKTRKAVIQIPLHDFRFVP